MRRSSILAAAFLCGLALAGCAHRGLPEFNGAWFTQVSGPAAVNPYPAPHTEKTGRAGCASVLGLVAWGDASIQTAMKAGGISRIHHVDVERFSVLGLYYSFTTVVYGE